MYTLDVNTPVLCSAKCGDCYRLGVCTGETHRLSDQLTETNRAGEGSGSDNRCRRAARLPECI
jgi:hypothetical protein